MATGTTEHVDATTAAVFLHTMYAKKAIVAREEQLVFANLVNRVFEEDATFGASIKVHSVGNLAAQTKATSDNAATIYETITESDKTITIGTWEYQGIAVETFTEVQADRDLIEMYAPKQGYALALSMDTTIAGLPDDFTNNVGTLIVELTYDDVLRARQYLDDANAPQEDRWWIVSPAQEAGFLKLDHYSNKDYGDLHGVPTAKPVQRAYIGTWLNIPIFKTTNVEGTNAAGHDNVLMQREALALVNQLKMRPHRQFDIDTLALKAVVEHIYGVGEMRDDHGVWAKGA